MGRVEFIDVGFDHQRAHVGNDEELGLGIDHLSLVDAAREHDAADRRFDRILGHLFLGLIERGLEPHRILLCTFKCERGVLKVGARTDGSERASPPERALRLALPGLLRFQRGLRLFDLRIGQCRVERREHLVCGDPFAFVGIERHRLRGDGGTHGHRLQCGDASVDRQHLRDRARRQRLGGHGRLPGLPRPLDRGIGGHSRNDDGNRNPPLP